jgi:hypothetical protein
MVKYVEMYMLYLLIGTEWQFVSWDTAQAAALALSHGSGQEAG